MRRRVIDVAAGGLLALFLGAAGLLAGRATWVRIGWAMRSAGQPTAAARLRRLGPAYLASIERIRRLIPASEPYLLLEAPDAEPGAFLWVRFDLLPRRAVRIARLRGGDCLQEQLRWLIVVSGHGHPPALLERPPRPRPGCPPSGGLARSGAAP
ncbi:MAG TPA: hypothetical protein VHQ90_20870 [Thermoanaerobaculia bacterium]|nr:hypothetical protein [Thermoanaerobaculia bacterium]